MASTPSYIDRSTRLSIAGSYAGSVHALTSDLDSPIAGRRRRAIRALTVLLLANPSGRLVTAAILARHGVSPAEEVATERWIFETASDDEFAASAVLRMIAGASGSALQPYRIYRPGEQRSPAMAMAVVAIEAELRDPGSGFRGDWVRGAHWSILRLCHTVATYTGILGRPDLADRLIDIMARLQQPYFAEAGSILLSKSFFTAIGHTVIARTYADFFTEQFGDGFRITYERAPTANRWLGNQVARLLAQETVAGAVRVPVSPDARYVVGPWAGQDAGAGDIWSGTRIMSWAATRWIDSPGIEPEAIAPLRERAKLVLAGLGVDPDRFIVTLHVRDDGGDGRDGIREPRNADIAQYAEAIDHIVARGGTVIRLGDRRMPALRRRPHVLDYPHTRAKCDWMDIALASLCRFHIGTASGMSFVPLLFGKPVLFTNWITFAHIVSTPRTMYLMKQLCRAGGTPVDLPTWCGRYRRAMTAADVEPDGLYFRENDADELLDAVQVFMATLDRTGDRAAAPDGHADAQIELFNGFGIDPAPISPPRAFERMAAA